MDDINRDLTPFLSNQRVQSKRIGLTTKEAALLKAIERTLPRIAALAIDEAKSNARSPGGKSARRQTTVSSRLYDSAVASMNHLMRRGAGTDI